MSHVMGAVELALAQQALADAAASKDSAQQLVNEATSLAAQVSTDNVVACWSDTECSGLCDSH